MCFTSTVSISGVEARSHCGGYGNENAIFKVCSRGAPTAAVTTPLSIGFHDNKWIHSHWCGNCNGTASKGPFTRCDSGCSSGAAINWIPLCLMDSII